MRGTASVASAVERHGYVLRKMLPEDLAAVMEIQRTSFAHPWSTDLFRRELEHDWSTILLAQNATPEGTASLLGLVIFWLVHDEVHILNVATRPEARRKGVARALLEAALDQGRQRRCTLATLEVRKTNTPAIALYQALGFRTVGLRPNYYVDEREDALVMLLELSSWSSPLSR